MLSCAARGRALPQSRLAGMNTANTIKVHVVEDHNEALPHMYRAIATKTLPFRGNTLLHFDAHPDLLSPDIKADDISDKEMLFSKTDIADWILPAIYMGHIERVVWIKPPWAEQILDGPHRLCLGRDKNSGQLRVSTPLPYFINELLYVDATELENITTIPLDVITLHPPSSPPPPPLTQDHDKGGKQEPNPLLCRSSDDRYSDTVSMGKMDKEKKSLVSEPTHEARDKGLSPPPAKITKLEDPSANCSFDECVVEHLSNSKAWILDIDLDYFSTANPFRSIYSEEQYGLLQRMYKLEEPENNKPNGVTECVEKREKQLSLLKKLWEGTDVISERDKIELKLEDSDVVLVEEMKDMIGSIRDDSFIDPEYLHTSGMVTDLPVHSSTEEEVSELMSLMKKYLQRITKNPSLITISRSAEDHYTPPAQVGGIQQKALAILQDIYPHQSTRSCDPYPHRSTRSCDPCHIGDDTNTSNPHQHQLEIHHHYTRDD